MKRALIITSDNFPRGNAGATRQEILAKLFCECEYSVDLIGMGKSTDFNFVLLCDQIYYMSLRNKNQNIFIRILDRLLFSKRVKKICKKNLKQYDAILVESIPYSLLRYIKSYPLRKDVILLHDSVEWYSASEFKMGRWSPEYIFKDNMNRKWITSKFRIIAISSFLQKHFQSKGFQCVRIPFIHDVSSVIPEKQINNEQIVFMYAGMMGRKDHLRVFFEAVNKLSDQEKKRIKIRIFGPDKNYIIKTKNADELLLRRLEGCLEIRGRVTRNVVEENLLSADYTILFRNQNERYAKAGFPTKVVESLMYATPVFCNLSSDLNMYLKDGVNSIIVNLENVDDIYEALKRILSLTLEERKNMQKLARKCAMENFDYRLYKDIFSDLVNGGM